MEKIVTLLENQILLTMFLTIAIGYLIGKINLRGFSLGSGAVLFAGLFIGAIAPKAAPPAILGTLGLLMFLYGVGIQYGKQFFKGMTSMEGLKANLAAILGVGAAGAFSLMLIFMLNVETEEALGIFAGSGTSTSTLQAILAVFKNDKATVGYSLAYPFGVAGPILAIYILNIFYKKDIPTPNLQQIKIKPVLLKNEEFIGKSLAHFLKKAPKDISIVAIRRESRNQIPEKDMILENNDLFLISTTNKHSQEKTEELLGKVSDSDNHIMEDRRDFDYIRVFVSKHNVVGKNLLTLDIPSHIRYSINHIRRGETDMMPHDNFVLEVGDRICIFVDKHYKNEIRNFFGDSISSLADFSYISIGIGASLGLLIGLIPLPIPGVGTISLGLAGLLLLALYLGKRGRTGSLVWEMPLPSNLVFRNFGLTIFLAQVGLSSGGLFFKTVTEMGFTYILYGAIVLLLMVFITAFMCLKVFKLPFDLSMGIVAAATGNPAILAFTSRLIPTEKPDVGYAMIFPSMTIVKILFVRILAETVFL
ncbi:MAG: TrkA C-terminal domain-containing protein [Alphaproteobacteria bacterium]